MTKWEYLTAPILTHAAKQILDNFGADGWELATSYHQPSGSAIHTFKRRK